MAAATLGSSRTTTAILVAAWLLMAAVPSAHAAHTTGDIVETVLAQAIIGRAPTQPVRLPPAGFPGTFGIEQESRTNVDFDEETVLNTIAIGRQGGSVPTARSTSNRDIESAHTIDVRTLPPPGPVLSALLITTFDSPIVSAALRAVAGHSVLGVKAPPLPIHLLQLSAQAWLHEDRGLQRVSLDAETTQAGLVLLAGGIPITTDDLTTMEHSTTHLARLEQDMALSIPIVAASVQLGARAAEPIALNELQDATRSSFQTNTHAQDVRVDPNHALLATAASRQLILVEPGDVIQGQQTVTRFVEDQQRATIDRGSLLSALLLGAHAVSPREPIVRAALTPEAIIGAAIGIDVTGGGVGG